jgi:predicted adenine nucleotide alpha hydrolase (AANH) superfamily ATPase
VNYQLELEKIIKENVLKKKRPKLLLHSCCAPCSSYVLEYLADYFQITVYYYNPNIFPESEAIIRGNEQGRLIEQFNQKFFPVDDKALYKEEEQSNISPVYIGKGKEGVQFLQGAYEKEVFYELAKGLEKEKEKGARCVKCYKLRLEETAKLGEFQGFDYFTSTLSISPLKDTKMLNNIGYELQEKYQIKWLPSDFKKKNGYQRSVELSRELGLYRQDYCGCEFSLENRRN